MKKIGYILIIIFTLNSCASIFNGNRTTVKVSADKASKIIFESDTISIDKDQTTIRPIRSKKPLEITVLKDTLQKDFSFDKKLSNTVFLNMFNYGLGLIADLGSEKRFRYKKNLYFITDSISNEILLSNKKVISIPKNTTFLYTSPVQSLDFFSLPMITVGTEYAMLKNVSLSLEYGFRNSPFYNRDYNISYLEEKGRMYRLETKWYNGINLVDNVNLNEYIGLEYRQINSQHNSNINYFLKSQSYTNYITDDFATKKKVTVVNLKHGFLIPIGKIFYIDLYYGLGLRIKKFDYINLEFDESIHKIKFSDALFSFNHREFKNYTEKSFLNLSLGFKFGIKLN